MFRMLNRHTESRASGQSLTEYGLGIGLVVLVSLAALMALGNQLQGGFKGMIGKAPAANQVVAASGAGGTGGSSDSGDLDEQSAAITDNLTSPVLAGDAQAIPADLAGFIQTAGANGTTGLFSDQIRQLGEQLLAQGEITDAQANAFYALANQGNRMATIEKLIEQAEASGSQSVTFEGKTYTPYELSRSIGWPDEPSSYYSMNVQSGADVVNRSPNSRSPEMQAFVNAYQTLEKSGGMSNPAISKSVGALSGKIAYLSEMVESNIADQEWGNTTTPLKDYVASSTSYWSASEICGTGGGNTSGVTCQ